MNNIWLFFFSICFTSIFNFSTLQAQAKKDSLLKRDVVQVIEELQYMYHLDQESRNHLEKLKNGNLEDTSEEEFSKAGSDSIWAHIISPLDSIKTARMLVLIEIYGFPSVDRLEKFSGRDLDFNPQILLIHAPFRFSEELIPIAEREYNFGNFRNKCEYGYLLWHLHGRKDFKYMLENGYKMETQEDGTFKLTATCD